MSVGECCRLVCSQGSGDELLPCLCRLKYLGLRVARKRSALLNLLRRDAGPVFDPWQMALAQNAHSKSWNLRDFSTFETEVKNA